MLPRNTFNIADWSLHERRDVGRHATLILRPKLKHAFFRLLFGTGLLALFTVGFLGIDHEIRSMREKRRFTEADVASFERQTQSNIEPFIAAGKFDEAKAIKQSGDAFLAKLVAERGAELSKLEASHRPWHILLQSLAALTIFCGLYLPLSPLWQRVRISREGGELIIRKNILPRTRRIHVKSVSNATVNRIDEHTIFAGQWMVVSHYWMMVLTHANSTVKLYLATTPRMVLTMPPHAIEFSNALRRLAN